MTKASTSYQISPGDPAPVFRQRTPNNPRYAFDTIAGRYIVLCFVGSAADAGSQRALRAVLERPGLFDDDHATFFAVSNDPKDESTPRLANRIPGFRVFWDFDRTIAKLYGVIAKDADPAEGAISLKRSWVLIDPTMRVMANIPFREDGGDVAEFIALLENLPPPAQFAGVELQAPVLFLPNVFEPELCRQLIQLYEKDGGTESGFMREVDGRTIMMSDPFHKRRKDFLVTDKEMIVDLQERFIRRVVPEIAKIHQFNVTRMERYVVACYAAEHGGHFMAHRDNTTTGTAHRRFAVSVNLNADFDGGEVSFPEYGPRGFKPPPGGAVVFSCSLLHQVSPVTRGKRYAFLPFLYDDAAAKIREKNAAMVGEKGMPYKA